jgi:WD40 repeat protein/serine/threonine protein kinase
MADPTPSERVAALADEFLDRHRRGERPPVREYADKYPELADEIRQVFPAVAVLENVAVEEPPAGPPPAPALARQVGDFRIVREVGRGGMGVVYEAEQVSLGRFVALKLLPAQLTATGRERDRFLREAKTAAKLHHTNIVPVFGFGEADGTPYYAMQFIRGQGLDAVVEELKGQTAGAQAVYGGTTVTRAANLARSLVTGDFEPADERPDATGSFAPGAEPAPEPPADPPPLPRPGAETVAQADTAVRSRAQSGVSSVSAVQSGAKRGRYTLMYGIARIGLQVAQALDHAHAQGVLHRDVKPSNLLLDAFGNTWVTDFGLAKAEGLPELTRVGDILGTLRYMPPEAFEGTFDARGDVYALGLTLYELLALRPAFDEPDRRKLLKLVSEGAPPPLRQIAPKVPRDLATIVHKAIRRDPGRRYQTAAELADDLRRFLDDRPIAARPVSALEHTWRACRRNPVLSGMGAAALLGLVVGLVGAVWGRAVADAQRVRAEKNEKDAQAERDAVKALNAQVEAQKEQLADRLYVADMYRAKGIMDAGGPDAVDLLNRHRPVGGQQDRRGLEWYYLTRLTNSAERTIDLPSRGLTLAYSDDGSRLVVGLMDRLVLIDPGAGKTVIEFPFVPGKRSMQSVAFAPGGKAVAAALGIFPDSKESGELLVWSTTGAPLARVEIDKGGAFALAFRGSADELFVGCRDGSVRVYDTRTWKEKATERRNHGRFVISVAVSPDGTWVASGGMDGKTRLWPRGGGMPTELDTGNPYPIQFSPDGKKLTIAPWGGNARVWDLTATPPRNTATVAIGVGEPAISPDGSILLNVTRDGAIRLFDTAAGRETESFRSPTGNGTSYEWPLCIFRPDGKAIAGCRADTRLHIWNLDTAFDSRALRGAPDEVQTVALGPDGKTVVGGTIQPDSKLRVYNADTGQLLKTLPAHAGAGVRRVRFSPDGKWLASVGDDGGLVLWDAATWAADPRWSFACLPKPPAGQSYYIGASDLDFTPDGSKLVVGTWNGALVHEFDLTGAALKRIRTWQVPDDLRVWNVGYSPDGKKVVTTVWTQDTGRDFGIVWDVTGERQKELFRVAAPFRTVAGAVFSPDGKEIAGGCLGAVRFWDAATGRPLDKQLRGASVGRPVYTRDGTRILAVGRSVSVYDARTSEELLSLRGHSQDINGVSVSADTQRLATCSPDKTIRLWDAPRK